MARGTMRGIYCEYDFVFWHSRDGKVYFGIKHSNGRYECLIEFSSTEYGELVRQGLEPVVEDRGSLTVLA